MARPTNREEREKINMKIGKGVSKMTSENIQKLKEGFAVDLTIEQACDYADISYQTYYNWIKKNPQLLEEFSKFKNQLSIKAKYNIAQRIHAGDVPLSERYLARKEPDQYGDRLKIEHSGAILSTPDILHPEDEALRLEYRNRLQDNLRKRAMDKAGVKPKP